MTPEDFRKRFGYDVGYCPKLVMSWSDIRARVTTIEVWIQVQVTPETTPDRARALITIGDHAVAVDTIRDTGLTTLRIEVARQLHTIKNREHSCPVCGATVPTLAVDGPVTIAPGTPGLPLDRYRKLCEHPSDGDTACHGSGRIVTTPAITPAAPALAADDDPTLTPEREACPKCGEFAPRTEFIGRRGIFDCETHGEFTRAYPRTPFTPPRPAGAPIAGAGGIDEDFSDFDDKEQRP